MSSSNETQADVTFLSSLRGKIVLFSTFFLLIVTSLCLYVLWVEQHISDLILTKQHALIQQATEMLKQVVFYLGIFSILLIVGCCIGLVLYMKKSIQVLLEFMQRLAMGNTEMLRSSMRNEWGVLIQVANQVAQNLNQASTFTKEIGEGHLNEKFKPVSEHDMLGNSLVQMRDKLKIIADEDARRNWTTKGMAFFGDLLRKYAEDYQGLTDNAIIELVKYVRGNQGGMFVLNTDNPADPFLELKSFYAYLRKKYVEKRIVIGEGLVGQCFLEKRTLFLKEVPADYTYITSGLGDGVPCSIVIVPIMANDVVEGIVELASFQIFQPHEIEFVEKICEQIAVMITSVKVRDKTRVLLAQSQQQAEEMRAQEEDARQNMEELQATQDHLQRQTEEMRKIQKSLENEKNMFDVLMEYLPDRITYKDVDSRILRINTAKAIRMNMKPEDVVGKTDFDFFTREHAEKAMEEERQLIHSGDPLVDIEERLTYGNEINWVSTSRIPFRNEKNQVTGMFIITRDITKLRLAEMASMDIQKIKKALLKNLSFVEFKVSNHGILSDLYSEKVKISSPWKGKHIREISVKMFKSTQDYAMQEIMLEDKVTINHEQVLCRYCLVPTSLRDGSFAGLIILNA